MATVKIILYKQKKLSKGNHPVMLQITNNSKVSRISLGFKCLPNNWNFEKCRFKRNTESYRDKNTILRNLESRAENILTQIKKEDQIFTPTLFKNLFLGVKKEMTVFKFLEMILSEMKSKGNMGNYEVYKGTRNAVKRFMPQKTNLMFEDINYNYLKKFEAYLFQTGCSGGGVSVYMRTLRALFNEAIRRDFISQAFYPFATSFNKKGYSLSKLKSTASPRALSIEDMNKIKNFNSDQHPKLKDSWLIFLFSYYCRGMNFTDIAYLQWTDIYNNRLTYRRKKTGRAMTILINENIQNIIQQFQPATTDLIFPILNSRHKTPEQKKNRIKKRLKRLNSDLKEIAKLLEIRENITSYTARHTYATTLKAKDVSVSKISQGMGHANVATTQAYLKRFEDREIDALDNLL